MAWRSSGINNNEMIDNLKRFGVISSGVVENGFRAVDRRHFVPAGNEELAHTDQPLKEGNIHISAPHIYGAALEALELKQNSTLSFLNIGSGTGYLSAIVAKILGPKSLNFGIEIHQDVIDHCHSSLKAWSSSHGPTNAARSHPRIIRGNGLCISASVGESILGFDRIYIGAAIQRSNLLHISKLLSPGGILVGPVDDNLVKVIRNEEGKHDASLTTARRDNSSAESGNESDEEEGISDGFAVQVLSRVRFASLLRLPTFDTIIPAQAWSPEEHQYFPDAFQKASSEIMMCANSDYVQPLPPQPKPEERVNVSAVLPKSLWVEVLSFTHRRWFAPDRNNVEYLKTRLQEEKDKAAKAEQARLDLEARCQVAERERDVYRLLARRWQSRLQAVLEAQRDMAPSAGYSASASGALQAELDVEEDEENDEEDDAAMMEEENYANSDGYAALSHDRSMEDVDGHNGIEDGKDDEAYFSRNQAGHEGTTDDDSVEMSDVEDGFEPADNAQMMTGAVGDLESQGKVRAVSIASEDL